VTVTAATFSGAGTITATNGRVAVNALAHSAGGNTTITLRGVGTSSGSANNNGNNHSLGTVSGVIANNGANLMAITKDDAGIWEFSNANTYTGVTTITNGVLRLNHATALPGGIGAAGGLSALTFNTADAGHGVLGLTVASGDFTRALGSGADQVQFNVNGGWAAYGGDRVVNLGGASAPITWATGTTGFNGRRLNLGAASATHTVDLQNPIDLGSAVRTVQVEDGPAALEANMSGVLSGVGGGLTKLGSGKLLLSGANNYTGVTTVILGTLVVTNPSALGTTAGNTTVGFFAGSGTTTGNLGATLDVQANIGLEPLSVGGFGVGGMGALTTSTGTGTVDGPITLTSKTMIGSEGILNIGGTLTANGHALTTIGDGVVNFGTTSILTSLPSLTVVDGTTNVNSTSLGTAGWTEVFVQTDGTLGGTGTINGVVNVDGMLSPGNSIESLATGTVNLNTGSTLVFESTYGSPNIADLLDITGSLNITGAVTLDLLGADLANPLWVVGDKLSVASYTGAWNGGTFAGWADDSLQAFGGNLWMINYDDLVAGVNFTSEQAGAAGHVTLTAAVPEPTSAMLLLGSSALLLLRRRRVAV
jgi:autotransporter-associated beta strand protein